VGTGRVFPLFGTAVVPWMVLASVAWAADDRPSSTEHPISEAATTDTDPESLRGPIPPTAPVILVPIPRGTVFQRHVIGGGGATASAGERLVYSNTLGTLAAALGTNRLVADDIATTAPNGCKLRRYEFPVVGKVDPAGIGGPYSVDFAFYSNCPGSVPCAGQSGLIIPGSAAHLGFSDEGPRLISFVPPEDRDVFLLTNLWLGVKFSRANAGVIMGAPALVGFSADTFDSPGFPCNASLGGFPYNPHASFNAEIYADADCPEAFVGYKNSRPSGSVYALATSPAFADDIQLGVNGCQMIAYEVAAKGVSAYTFDMRLTCDGPAIPGTERFFTIGSGTDVKVARFTVDPPVPLPQGFWFAVRRDNPTAGVVIAGQQASVGQTEDVIGVLGDAGCSLINFPNTGIRAALNVAITCAGAPPVGACCDMFFPDETGEAVCRQVPETNCAFPPRFSSLQPAWVDGEACEPDPFGNHPCGQAACCYADQQGDQCANLTRAACDEAGDPTRPRQWQIGRYCSDGGQRCPRIACLGRTGECTLPRCNYQGYACTGGANNGLQCSSGAQCPGGRCDMCTGVTCHVGPTCCDSCPPVGCENVDCCTTVCDYGADGRYCCAVEWDDVCASLANELCSITLANDVCVPDPIRRIEGARLLVIGPHGFVTAEADSGNATADTGDPGFGCYKDNPGAQGLQTVWYKFVATQTSALFQTCNSNAPADDSLLQVFAVGDPSTPVTQCNSLIPIGCSDDFPGCSSSNTNSKICVQGLIPGNLYYVLVASKFPENPGKKYRLDISSICDVVNPVPNNDCPAATTITDGSTPFNLSYATLTAPIELCIPTMVNDVWYNYTATCSGTLTVDTCGANAETSPDTNLAIYDACLCPPVAGAPIVWSANAGGECGTASRVTLDVVGGSCYKIRLADSNGNRPSGQIKIECVPDQCANLSPADSDFDGDVDLIDLAAFQRCYAWAGSCSRDSCCRTFDITRDGDIDFDDWADFLVRFKGP